MKPTNKRPAGRAVDTANIASTAVAPRAPREAKRTAAPAPRASSSAVPAATAAPAPVRVLPPPSAPRPAAALPLKPAPLPSAPPAGPAWARQRPVLSRDQVVAAAKLNEELHAQLQLVFPFPSLDFPGRATLTVAEIAAKLGWSGKHIADLIAEGDLPCVDGKGRDAKRGSFRVPVECYRDFITARLTGGRRLELLCLLPKTTLRDLVRELSAFLERE